MALQKGTIPMRAASPTLSLEFRTASPRSLKGIWRGGGAIKQSTEALEFNQNGQGEP